MKKTLTLLTLTGAITLPGCGSLQVAPASERNQFESTPKSATTRPAIVNFRSPFEQLNKTFDQQLLNIEQDLRDCLEQRKCKQPTS